MTKEPFAGWPKHTYDWLSDLEANNDKPWFDANRVAFDEIKASSQSFVHDLAATMELTGTPKVWRIYRDQRFAKGEPYKTDHDMGVLDDDGVLHGLRIGPNEVVVAFGIGGIGGFAKTQLANYREAVADQSWATEFASRLDALIELGFELGEPELKRPLKTLADDHPHPDLSRRKSLFLTKTYSGKPTWLFKPTALTRVADDLGQTTPVRSWLLDVLG